MTIDEFIKEHCETGQINLGVGGWAYALVCKYDGCFIWDVEKHMLYSHGITREQ